jgi:hypothetical protein
LGVVEADPLADHALGHEAVVQLDALVFQQPPQRSVEGFGKPVPLRLAGRDDVPGDAGLVISSQDHWRRERYAKVGHDGARHIAAGDDGVELAGATHTGELGAV